MDATGTLVEVLRSEGVRVLATLARTIGDLAVAEDALSEATITALDAWPKTGIPDNPRAWLAVVARRKALDLLRRESARAAKETAAFRWGTGAAPDQIEEAIEAMEPETSLRDDMLRLIFTCCHPALSREAQVALSLRALARLEEQEILAIGQTEIGFLDKIAYDDTYTGPALDPSEGERLAGIIGPDKKVLFMANHGVAVCGGSVAEAYDLLRAGLGASPAELAGIFRNWNEGDLDSFLIKITAEVLAHTDAATGKPFVDVVLDQAEQKGTGRWTVQDALDLGVPVSGIAEAVFARSLSGHADLRRAARNLPGPRPTGTQNKDFADQVEQALYASKLVSYAQGWNMMDVGSREYDWHIDLGQIAVIWRGGCIIRAAFLDRIRAAYQANPELPTLLADEDFGKEIAAAQDSWRNVVATAARLGIPVPGFSAALAYYDALRAERLPAALIQGLRDYFGAHTYRRTDRDGVFHTLWAQDRSEEAR